MLAVGKVESMDALAGGVADTWALLQTLDAGEGVDSRLLLLARLRPLIEPLLNGSDVVMLTTHVLLVTCLDDNGICK